MKMTDITPIGNKRWMATFADLITLLLTFFVIMLGMARVDIERFQQALNSLRKDRGVDENMKNIDAGADSLLSMNSSSRDDADDISFADLIRGDTHVYVNKAEVEKDLQEMMAALEQLVKENNLENDVSLELSPNGIRLRVKGKIMFDPGHAEIKPIAFRFINGIAKALRKSEFFLLVEGHTDSTPIATSKYPSNWELSGARACSVIRHLINRGIDKFRLSAIGYADNYPIAINSVEGGRSLNRRVEFIFTKFPTRVVI